ncbi:hypothetical protein Adu01nite_63940 [Paractinoplanes durhamensis]|uniref:MFS transporter n=1 Tax=Paractinoplanes durhamensis TaxID=113563 RepID=A0ABQ3Z5G5_9ACTN|nr:hypothetical protein Adu01nite_63940 [Actinoplanes durhamensis]
MTGTLRPGAKRHTGDPQKAMRRPRSDERSGFPGASIVEQVVRDLLDRRGMDMALIAGFMIFYGFFIGVALTQ